MARPCQGLPRSRPVDLRECHLEQIFGNVAVSRQSHQVAEQLGCGPTIKTVERGSAAYTLNELALSGIKQLETNHARNPQVLIGHCFGGWLALELARQLEAEARPPARAAVCGCHHPWNAHE